MTSTFVVTTNDNAVLKCHRAGCADIVRRDEHVIGKGDTIAEAATDAHSDFLREGSMTEADALAEVKVLRCTRN